MSIEKQFYKFYENIKLTSLQKEDAKIKYNGVCKKLHDYYYPNIEYTGKTKLLVGSYGKGTHIRPARDIDVVFVLPSEKFDQYNDNLSNCQSQLLQDIKKILEEKYSDTNVRAFGKVVVVEFSEGRHKVEVVPAWEKNDGTFVIPNSENGGHWNLCDYRKSIEIINNSNKSTGRTKMLIRMIKKWSENCTAKVSSFQIEESVLNFLMFLSYKENPCSVFVRDFFEYFYKNENDSELKSHLLTALNRSNKACDFENEGKLKDSAIEWQKIFGRDFPVVLDINSKEDSFDNKLIALYKLYPSEKEEYLDSKYGITTSINTKYFLKIDAMIEQKKFRPFYLSDFLSKKIFLLKRKKLTFKIIKSNIPEPFQVKWKVRNFGKEAMDANDLRGEIMDDDGSKTKIENTKYSGEHYVECYIIKNNICIAKSKILVPISNN